MNNSSSSSLTLPGCPLNELLYSFNTINLTTEIKSTWISLQVINGAAAPVTFAINVLIIWVILEKETLRSNKSNILLAALAFTDLLVSLFPQPFFIWVVNCFLRDGCTVPCEIKNIFVSMHFLFLLSLTSLMLVSVDRFLAIQRPFQYQEITTKNVAVSVVFVWSFLSILTILNFVLRSFQVVEELSFELCMTIVESLVSSICSGKVQIVAYRQIKTINGQIMAIHGESAEEQRQEHNIKYEEYRKAFIMCMIVFSSFFMYCPFIVFMTIERLDFDVELAVAMPIAFTFFLLQSLINPLITLRLSYIRGPVLGKLRKLLLLMYEMGSNLF